MSLLRPNQVAEAEATRQSLEAKLENKHIRDKGAVRGQLKRLQRVTEAQTPQEVPVSERDKVAKETDELLDKILVGMPSQAEMRKCPPGAVDKHRSWETRNKRSILKWKENMLRLNAGTTEVDVANLEKYRPTRSSLNMDNAVIPGTDYHLPEQIKYSVPFSTEDIRLIRERAPVDVWTRLATLDAEQRALLRMQFIETWEEPSVATEEVHTQSVPPAEEEQVAEEHPPAAVKNPRGKSARKGSSDSTASLAALWPGDN